MRLLENLTVKASWFLVLLFFSSMIVVLSGLGLYALQQGSGAVTAMAVQAGESGAGHLEAFATMERLIHWGIVLVLAGSAVAMVVVVWGISTNVLQPLARLVGYFEGLAKGDRHNRLKNVALTKSVVCLLPSNRCRTACRALSARYAVAVKASTLVLRISPKAMASFPHVPSNRPLR